MTDLIPASGPAATKRTKAAVAASDEAVYRAIHDAILEQRLPPGTKLTEETLAEVFAVSRTVIRKALLRLAYDEMAELRPNRGATVAQPTPEEARDVFETRRLIEAAVIVKAVRAATPAQLAALRALVEEEERTTQAGDRRGALRLSGDFHLRLAEIAGNAVYTAFLRRLISRTSLILALYEAPGTSACTFNEHRALIDAMAAGDEDGAANLMEHHLRDLERRINLDGDEGAVDLKQVFAAVRLNGR